MKPIFRNSMFGFHKEDVYNFITKQSRQYESKINELTKEKELIETECEKHSQLCSVLSGEMECLRDVNDRREETLVQIKAVVESFLGAMNEVLISADLCDSQSKAMEETMASVEEHLKRADLVCEKAQKFDLLSNILGGSNVSNAEKAQEASVVSAKEFAFPENNGIDRLRSAVSTLSQYCDELNMIVNGTKSDE